MDVYDMLRIGITFLPVFVGIWMVKREQDRNMKSDYVIRILRDELHDLGYQTEIDVDNCSVLIIKSEREASY
jgi:hypothetical protein